MFGKNNLGAGETKKGEFTGDTSTCGVVQISPSIVLSFVQLSTHWLCVA